MVGIVVFDLATFAVSLTVLNLVRVPETVAAPSSAQPWWSEITQGLRFVRGHAGLLALLILYAGVNLSTGTANALYTPMILGFADRLSLGVILSCGGIGMVVGSMLVVMWKGPTAKVRGSLIGVAGLGFSMVLAWTSTSVAFVAAATFLMYFCLPIINGYDLAVWQALVPEHVRGRVLAVRAMIATSTLPIAYALAGPFGDRVESLPTFALAWERGQVATWPYASAGWGSS